jgi:hypothetical protein
VPLDLLLLLDVRGFPLTSQGLAASSIASAWKEKCPNAFRRNNDSIVIVKLTNSALKVPHLT